MIGALIWGFTAAAAIAFAGWMASIAKRDVSIVDSLWSLMILACGLAFVATVPAGGWLAPAALALATIWALRLSAYITWRHRGKEEDRRYQAIRRRNEPHFAIKSLYLVFGLQAVLATIVSTPLLGIRGSEDVIDWLAAAGCVLTAFGIVYESIADAQLTSWRRSGNDGVLDRGLWRYSRHPNYFGEFCVWWGLGIAALAAGAWWALASPVLMTILLLRVSGVTLLEADLEARRPAYREYARRTNAFFPGP